MHTVMAKNLERVSLCPFRGCPHLLQVVLCELVLGIQFQCLQIVILGFCILVVQVKVGSKIRVRL